MLDIDRFLFFFSFEVSEMALAWATEAVFDRLCKENFDGNGSIKVDPE